MEEIINKALAYTEKLLALDSSGHDYQHILRVYQTSLKINEVEKGDPLKVSLIAILHDIDDHKLFTTSENKDNATRFLLENKVDSKVIATIINDIKNISYSQGNSQKLSPEGKIVCDADRLDAIGAIGIGRCFAYSGAKGRSLADSLKHFDEKLFKLEDLMFTETAKKIAKQRTIFLKLFYKQYQLELTNNDLK